MNNRLQVTLPRKVKETIDELVKDGMYLSINEFLREASRKHLRDITQTQTNIDEE